MLSDLDIDSFRQTVWDYYKRHGRTNLPWRNPSSDGTFDPYAITVSELMLQQTQVARVVPKYEEFLKAFPSVADLAEASLGDVLRVWSGLGYNRRAKFLHQAARMVVSDFGGHFPSRTLDLASLPGIGINTAGAIAAYAYNQPVTFIETNIRTVYLHYFHADEEGVADRVIREEVTATVDPEHPREWYWALMDYGAHLKKSSGNHNVRSRHYAKQSTFHGSKRQVRGAVIKVLAGRPVAAKELAGLVPDERLSDVLAELEAEGLIRRQSDSYTL